MLNVAEKFINMVHKLEVCRLTNQCTRCRGASNGQEKLG